MWQFIKLLKMVNVMVFYQNFKKVIKYLHINIIMFIFDLCLTIKNKKL